MPKKIDKVALDEAEICSEMNQQFLLAKRYLDIVHLRMNQQEELYRTFIDKNTYPHGARVFDPRIFRIIETITPRMVANEPTGTFYPREDGDIVTSQILSALMKYDWYRAEMFPKLVLFVKSMLIFGTAFGRTFWDFRECDKERMVAKKVAGRVVWTPKNKETYKYTEFDGPNFETLNIYDCFPDPNASTLANMRWFIYRTFSTLKELKSENDARTVDGQPAYWKNLDKLETLMEDAKDKNSQVGGGRPADLQFRQHRRIMLSTQEYIGEDASNPEVVILRRITKDKWTYIVPEYDLVIREVDNPYFHGEMPIIYGVDYPYPGELYGMGEIEPIDRIQRAINAVLNQRLDNVQLTLRTMWKVKKDSGVDLHTLISAPGNIITTDDMNAVEALQTPDVTGPTFVQTMNYLTSAIQNGSGVTDYTQGIQTPNLPNKTATGIHLIQNEANAQFKLKIQLFNHMVIQRIVNQWKDLRLQYTTESQKLRILGKDQVKNLRDNTNLMQTTQDGEQINPGETDKVSKLQPSSDGSFAFLNLDPSDIQSSIVGDYDFIASVDQDQLVDPAITQQNFFAALDRVMSPEWSQLLFRSGKMVNAEGLTPEIFEKLSIGNLADNILIDFPKGQEFNFDKPNVQIKYEDLPAAGKAQAAQMAGIQIDPKDPELQRIGRTDTRINVQGDDPQATQVLQNAHVLPDIQPPQGLPQQNGQPAQQMTPEQMQQIMAQQQQHTQGIQQAVQGNLPQLPMPVGQQVGQMPNNGQPIQPGQ